MICYVCHEGSDLFVVVGRSDDSGEEEMNLCERCASIAFPGLSEMIRCDCRACELAAAAGCN